MTYGRCCHSTSYPVDSLPQYAGWKKGPLQMSRILIYNLRNIGVNVVHSGFFTNHEVNKL